MEESLTIVTPTGDEGIFDGRNFQQVMKESLPADQSAYVMNVVEV